MLAILEQLSMSKEIISKFKEMEMTTGIDLFCTHKLVCESLNMAIMDDTVFCKIHSYFELPNMEIIITHPSILFSLMAIGYIFPYIVCIILLYGNPIVYICNDTEFFSQQGGVNTVFWSYSASSALCIAILVHPLCSFICQFLLAF